jgi:hypothetical protein
MMMPFERPATTAAHRWTLVLLFAVLAGVQLLQVLRFAAAVPFWDQWDSEIALLMKPWVEGELSLAALIAPHNEHRIAFSRLWALLLFELNGREVDNLVGASANTALHAAVLVLLYARLRAGLATRARVVLAL